MAGRPDSVRACLLDLDGCQSGTPAEAARAGTEPGTAPASYDLLRGIEIPGRLALGKMLAGTEIAPAGLMSCRLEDLDLVAFMVDGGPSSYPHAAPPLRT